MNEKDKAAWAHFSGKFDKDAWEFKEGFESALAHRDAQVADQCGKTTFTKKC